MFESTAFHTWCDTKIYYTYMYNLLSFFVLWKNRRNERAPELGFLFGEQGDRKWRARDRMCDKPLKQWVTLPGACAEYWSCISRGLWRRRGDERVEEVSKESEVEEPTWQKKGKRLLGWKKKITSLYYKLTKHRKKKVPPVGLDLSFKQQRY